MKRTRTILAAAMFTAIGSAALAQQALTGTVTTIDRISGTISVQQTESGTVGASDGGAAERYKVQDSSVLNALHAGDRVSFSVGETGGTRTITKIEKR